MLPADLPLELPCCSPPPCRQDVDLPAVPQGEQAQAQAQQADEFGLPAIPQRT